MGRKKIQISRITDERNRQVTFNKRKFGVMKKAYELSVLCDCEIALIIFSSSNKLYQYASTDMDKVLLKYTEYNEPHESLTNKNIIEALNKKEHKNGNCSPESPDPDPEYSLTPRTEAKYNKIDEEFQMMMQRNHLNGSRASMGPGNYNMAVSVPVNSTYGDSSLMQPSPQMPHGSVSPRPSSSGTDPGEDLRGGLLDMSNGYPGSTSPLPGSSSPGLPGKKQGSPGSRPSLRVVIPTASQSTVTLASEEQPVRTSVTALNTPVVSLQTPSIPGMASYPSTLPNSFATAQDYSVNPELSLTSLSTLHSWNPQPGSGGGGGGGGPLSGALNPSSGLTHLGVSGAGGTPPPPPPPHQQPPPPPPHQMSQHHHSQSSSPLMVRIKSEPISPPRDSGAPGANGGGGGGGGGNQLSRPSSTGGHLSPSGHLTPTPGHLTPNNHPSPGDPHGGGGGGHSATDYDGMPLQKRPRLNEGWAT